VCVSTLRRILEGVAQSRLRDGLVADVGDVADLLLPVEDGRGLERLVLGLDEEDIDLAQLEREECTVYNVLVGN
jgi:hypothetical protein